MTQTRRANAPFNDPPPLSVIGVWMSEWGLAMTDFAGSWLCLEVSDVDTRPSRTPVLTLPYLFYSFSDGGSGQLEGQRLRHAIHSYESSAIFSTQPLAPIHSSG